MTKTEAEALEPGVTIVDHCGREYRLILESHQSLNYPMHNVLALRKMPNGHMRHLLTHELERWKVKP